MGSEGGASCARLPPETEHIRKIEGYMEAFKPLSFGWEPPSAYYTYTFD